MRSRGLSSETDRGLYVQGARLADVEALVVVVERAGVVAAIEQVLHPRPSLRSFSCGPKSCRRAPDHPAGDPPGAAVGAALGVGVVGVLAGLEAAVEVVAPGAGAVVGAKVPLCFERGTAPGCPCSARLRECSRRRSVAGIDVEAGEQRVEVGQVVGDRRLDALCRVLPRAVTLSVCWLLSYWLSKLIRKAPSSARRMPSS